MRSRAGTRFAGLKSVPVNQATGSKAAGVTVGGMPSRAANAGSSCSDPVVQAEPKHQFWDSYMTLAECYDRMGQAEKARAAYEVILGRTTVSRAYYGYGLLLDRQGDKERAREMMRQILAKKPALPRYLRRQERPWFKKAEAFLKGA